MALMSNTVIPQALFNENVKAKKLIWLVVAETARVDISADVCHVDLLCI